MGAKLPSSSALYWLPRITTIGLKTPKSLFVPYDHNEAMYWYARLEDGQCPGEEGKPPFDQVQEACEEIGYPCFLRTDQASAKHAGPNAYKIREPGDVEPCVMETIEDNEMKRPGLETPRAFVVREFIDVKAGFAAFGHGPGHRRPGLPIAPEWRFYASQDEVACVHWYWPKDTIEFQLRRADTPDGPPNVEPDAPDGWEEILEDMQDWGVGDGEAYDWMRDTAKRAAVVCDRERVWSVDYVLADDDRWWLIDMAPAQRSWHPEDCANHDALRQGYVVAPVRNLKTGEVLVPGR